MLFFLDEPEFKFILARCLISLMMDTTIIHLVWGATSFCECNLFLLLSWIRITVSHSYLRSVVIYFTVIKLVGLASHKNRGLTFKAWSCGRLPAWHSTPSMNGSWQQALLIKLSSYLTFVNLKMLYTHWTGTSKPPFTVLLLKSVLLLVKTWNLKLLFTLLYYD